MSVFVAARIPDELAAAMDADGRGRTTVLVAALRAYFLSPGAKKPQSTPVPGKTLQTAAVGTTGAKVTIARKVETLTGIPAVTTASRLPIPAKQHKPQCAECGAIGGNHQRWCGRKG
jgi:hypothetical protein